jgi:putative ABC transport system permease protein
MRFKPLALLAWRSISGSAFRSWLIGFCALVIAGFALSTVLVMQGARNSLDLTLTRLGADILVAPQGAEEQTQGALLMGQPVKAYLPLSKLAEIQSVPGVEKASPQLYLESLADAPCCSVANMFMVAYDPKTDFTLGPWLTQKIGRELTLGESVGGKYVFVPEGEENIELYGYILSLTSNLEPTGTNLDNTIFITFDTAREMARLSTKNAVQPLVIPDESASSILVKVAPGYDPNAVATDIFKQVQGVTPVQSPQMFSTFRDQVSGVGQAMLLVLGLALGLSLLLIGFVFSIAVNERRRQIGVLRALGATRGAVIVSLLTEATILATAGAVVGVILASVGIYLFRDLLTSRLGFFSFPSPGMVAGVVIGGLVLAIVCVAIAAFVPAFRISRQEPATSMRE